MGGFQPCLSIIIRYHFHLIYVRDFSLFSWVFYKETKLASVTKRSVKRVHYVGFFCKTLCIAIIAALFIFVTEWPFSNTHILVWWFQWYNMNPLKEPCIAYVPEGIIESINPPIEIKLQ
jgi:hypothetical protein